MRPSDSGPNRKYYDITKQGEEALEMIQEEWRILVDPVNELLQRGIINERETDD